MMLFDVVVIIGCLFTSIENFFAILIGRFIEGIAAGANTSIVPLYVNEITPLQISGKMVSKKKNLINFKEFQKLITIFKRFKNILFFL